MVAIKETGLREALGGENAVVKEVAVRTGIELSR